MISGPLLNFCRLASDQTDTHVAGGCAIALD